MGSTNSRAVGALYIATDDQFEVDDVPEWMWERARDRPGAWTVVVPVLQLPSELVTEADANIPLPQLLMERWMDRASEALGLSRREQVVERRVTFTESEFALLDKVVTNQKVAESKAKVFRPITYQRAVQTWASGSADHVAMRMLGPWAIAAWSAQQQHKFTVNNTCWGAIYNLKRKYRVQLLPARSGPYSGTTAPGSASSPSGGDDKPADDGKKKDDDDDQQVSGDAPAGDGGDAPPKPVKNKLGYQREGTEYVNTHPCGGNDEADSAIRAEVQGRILVTDAGIGVVGQCEERMEKKARPFTATEADKVKLGRFVSAAISNTKNAPFSSKKIFDCIHEMTYARCKSRKWGDMRMDHAIEALCQRVDPSFRLKASVKPEPMAEEKAPRLLIADQDEGQIMALLTIFIIEYLIKKHFPKKGIKGLAKKDALKRVCEECGVPKKIAKKLITAFEGDGTAWDTTCSIEIRDLVENPVIKHVAKHVNAFLHSSPESWADQHVKVCCDKTLTLTFTKNKERMKFIIKAIRRSGHRGTSPLNWWMNFTGWHCAVFEHPEEFLNPDVKWGVDVIGIKRWLASAFEGDDSFLTTAPAVTPELDVAILQFWERIGFNMKIQKRDKHALFVGYRIALDENGPKKDAHGNFVFCPEVDRCMCRAGTSTSASSVQAFMAGDKEKLKKLSGTAAMSRAYEYAGLVPTISEKYLEYALELGFEVSDHDLRMRVSGNPDAYCRSSFDRASPAGFWGEVIEEGELVDSIRALNGICSNQEEILKSTGFEVTTEELNKFRDFNWTYDTLADWQGFRESLPATWRS